MTAHNEYLWLDAQPCAKPPFVLLHGFTGSPQSWEAVASCLAPGAAGQRAITALTLPGHRIYPQTAPVPVQRGFLANIDAIALRIRNASSGSGRLLDADLGCHLVGYSLGARAALGIAARHPALISALTLIGVHPGLASEHERAARVAQDGRWIDCLRTGDSRTFAADWQAQPLFATQARLPADVLYAQQAIRAAQDPEGLAQSLEHMGLGVMPNYRLLLASLPMPVRLVTGALDEKFTALAAAMATEIPSARHITVARCGHNLVLEAPEELAAILLEE